MTITGHCGQTFFLPPPDFLIFSGLPVDKVIDNVVNELHFPLVEDDVVGDSGILIKRH